jgi:hypothetical protein
MTSQVATAQLVLRRRPFAGNLLLRVRRLQATADGAELVVAVNGRALRSIRLQRGWRSVRLATKAGLWRQGANAVRFKLKRRRRSIGPETGSAGLVAVDYLMLAESRRDGAGERQSQL